MLSHIQSQLLQTFCDSYDDKKGPYSEVIKGVNFILHDNRKLLESSVEILGEDAHNSGVKQYISCSCGRKCWKVQGSHDHEYICLSNYCSCPSFLLQNKTAEKNICKHLLAIKLATMMGTVECEIVSDERFVELLCQEMSTASIITTKSFRTWRK